MTDRTKPGVAFWATVVVVVSLLYPLSWGPACWAVSRTEYFYEELPGIYLPIGWLCIRSPLLAEMMDIYGRLGMPSKKRIFYPIGGETFATIETL